MSEEILHEGSGINFKFRPAAFAAISLLIVFFLYQLVGGGLTVYLFGIIPSADQTTAVRLATMGAEIMFILVPAYFLSRIQTMEWRRLLSIRKTDWYFVFLAIVGVISLEQLLELYLYVQGLIPLPAPLKHILDQFQQIIEQTYKTLLTAKTPFDFLLVVLVVAVTPAICEETLFRGLTQGNFRLSMSNRKAIILTGIIFGFYHLDPFTFVALCVLGIYLSYLLAASESIIVPMVAHFTNNFISTLVLYAMNRDSYIAPSGGPPLSVGYIIGWSAVLALIFGVTVILTEQHKHNMQEVNQR